MHRSRDFAPEFNPELISRPSDLVNRFGFSFAYCGSNVSLPCDRPVLFNRVLSQPVLSDLGLLVTLMCLERFCIREVTPCGPDRACSCQVTPRIRTGC